MRTYLLANERNQIWSRGRLLAGTLQAIVMPVLDETKAAANLEEVHLFMNELRQRVGRLMGSVSPELLNSLTDILDLGQIEVELQNADQRIDALVFQLYNIQAREDIQLIGKILS